MLSYESPVHVNPSAGTWFHSLHATSQALQPMHSVESVRKALTGKMLTSHQRIEIIEGGAPLRPTPRSMWHTSPLVSMIRTFGSSDIAIRSFADRR